MKHDHATAVNTIGAEIEAKRSELKMAEETLRRVQILRMEISALERARAILEGKTINQFDLDHGSIVVGPGTGRLVITPTSVRTEVSSQSTDLYKRQESIPAMVFNALKESGKPLASDEIMAALLMRDRNLNRPSVLGAIYRNAKAGRMFRVIKPGVFGLLAWFHEGERAPGTGG